MIMKHILNTTLMLLALLCPASASAYDYECGGIFYTLHGYAMMLDTIEATVSPWDAWGYWGYFPPEYDQEELDYYSELYLYSGNVTIPASFGITNFAEGHSIEYGDFFVIVTGISYDAFHNCIGLNSINIPNSVTYIGEGAFDGCSSLVNITVASDNPAYDTRNNCNALIETSSNKLIRGCNNTVIPNSVRAIGKGAFSGCTGLTSIDIPNSVTTIGDGAFQNCSGLNSITIPESVTSIGSNAFSGCSSLNDVYSDITDPSKITMGSDVFYRNPNNYDERTLHVPTGTVAAYQADSRWSDYFGSIVEPEPDPLPAEAIKLNVTTAGLNEGASLQLTATVLPENSDKTVLWSSNNPSVATVDNNGLVTTHSVGTATITAMTTDGSNLSSSCTVTLLPVGVKGDMNGDGNVSITDVASLIDYLLSK